jgi:hypothetical protein
MFRLLDWTRRQGRREVLVYRLSDELIDGIHFPFLKVLVLATTETSVANLMVWDIRGLSSLRGLSVGTEVRWVSSEMDLSGVVTVIHVMVHVKWVFGIELIQFPTVLVIL